jgi:hypothetical protein
VGIVTWLFKGGRERAILGGFRGLCDVGREIRRESLKFLCRVCDVANYSRINIISHMKIMTCVT